MADVRAAQGSAGLVAASLFSGCGGSCLGWRLAGFSVRYANDVDPDTWASYEANAAEGSTLDRRSVREVRGDEVLEACGVGAGELDVLEGSPPCTQFSMLGGRAGVWGREVRHAGIVQRVDDLFGEYVRLVRETMPRAFVAENVEGLALGVARGYLAEVLAGLRSAGYRVAARVLDAQWLGVPQHRTRVIVVGAREDLGRDPSFPAPEPRLVPAAEALDLGGADPSDASLVYRGFRSARWQDQWRSAALPAPTVTATGMGGASRQRTWLEVRRRGSIDPPQRRRLRVEEVAGLCSFPEGFRLEGSYDERWARLGNSVPPLMARAVALEVGELLGAR